MGEVLRRDADAGVRDADDGLPAAAGERGLHLAAPGRVLDGVVDDVVDHLLELQAVAADAHLLLHGEVDLDAVLPGQGQQALHLFLQKLVQAHVGQVQLHAAAVHVHQGQKVGNDAVQAVDLGVHVAQEVLGHRRIHGILIKQRLDQNLHGAQRGLELMGGIGDELAAGSVQGLDLLRHGVEGPGQLGELVPAAHVHPRGEVAAGHLPDALAQFTDGPGEDAHHEHAEDQHQQRDHHQPAENLPLDAVQVFVDFLHGGDVHQRAHLTVLKVDGVGVEAVHGADVFIEGERRAQPKVAACAGIVEAVVALRAGEHVCDLLVVEAGAGKLRLGVQLHHAVGVHNKHAPGVFIRCAARECIECVHIK